MPTALSWSGGKGSALTLSTLRGQGVESEALITTITEEYDRISMHGVRRELLATQATAAGIPLVEVSIPPTCVNGSMKHAWPKRLPHRLCPTCAPTGSVDRSSPCCCGRDDR